MSVANDRAMERTDRFDVTTLGEVMLRLSVPIGERLEMARTLDAHPGGAEANLVSALARLGRPCAWVSGLPKNPLGRLIANHLRTAGVDLSAVVWFEEGRLGTYYLEFATPPRPTQVIYDRADSCASRLSPDQIDWDYMMDAKLLHLTGITPPLSDTCLAVTKEAVRRAKENDVAISFDVNYRQKLWSEAAARECLTELIGGVDLLFCGRTDAKRIFDIDGSPEEVVQGLADLSGAQNVIVSVGEAGVVAWNGSQLLKQPALPVEIVDRLGAGDALAAGVIHGWLDSGDLARGLRYGTVLAGLALSMHGDTAVTTPEEVEALFVNSEGGLIR